MHMNELDKVAGYTDVVTGSHDARQEVEGAATIAPVSSPELKTLVAVAVGTLAVAALYLGRDVLIPITLAIMLSFVLSPIVNLLQKLRLWRAPAVILTVVAALGVLGLVATLIGSQAASLTADAPRYAKTIEAKVERVQVFAVARLASITKQLGSGKAITAMPQSSAQASIGPGQSRPVPVEIVQGSTSPLTIARTVLAPILGPLETTIIVLIVAIFVLMQREDLRDRFIRVFGSSDLHRTTRAMDDAAARLSKYFLSQLAVNTCFGIVIALGLWAIGIPSPALWGILAGFLRFVPYIGPFLAAVAPAALGAAVDPGWTMAIEVLALFVVVEPLTGYVVEPLLYGHSTGLSPVSVIVSAIFWSWSWGPIGLIMSTPLTLCFVVMGRHVKTLEIFDVLLGDRPALTPVESFYQRIVANNPDEALAQAETLLADRSLADYYDGVVLEGLKLAVEDASRGTIDRAGSVRMARSMLSVIADLKPFAVTTQAVSAEVRAPSVVCVAGHGAFDEPVTAMLVQLLGARSIAARAIGNAAVSRGMIESLDLDGVDVVAISYLQLEGSPAQLRYLVRRLRGRAPDARIVVGLWPQGEAALSDPAIQQALGADAYVGTLAAAVDDIAPVTEGGAPTLATPR
jgi:predicted PurR-regulated permease PerM